MPIKLLFSLMMFWCASSVLNAATLELYVDSVTKQVYTEAGPNRLRLGVFQQVEEGGKAESASVAAGGPADAGTHSAHGSAVPHAAPAPAPTVAATPASSPSASPAPQADEAKWYDKLGIRGYTQLRYNHALDDSLDGMALHSDKSIGEDQSLFIRRLRVILSGDINERMSLYLQPDFAVTPSGSSSQNLVQLRDAYLDFFFDRRKEFRLRVGQSKIPYGFENLQSSQNRLDLDRADAINSCCKDERDLGAFLYWAPDHIRKRFKDLVASGLKGSGDYGVLGFGIYNGQGANRTERNDNFHYVARATWPWQFANGQIFEAGVQAVTGRFVPTVEATGSLAKPVANAPANGFRDQRVGLHAVLYPQPFGLQAEWNWGRGPELSDDYRVVEEKSLNGGYVQAMYSLDSDWGHLMPFLRWQHFDGAMKFERNAPATQVDEFQLGLEWQFIPALELTTIYVMTDRTDVVNAPYAQYEGDLLRLQLQWNY
ncbi:MAG: porin [Gammaproteobacteria bacterium]|nr:porin [Gammaproteobacteria bacterium]